MYWDCCKCFGQHLTCLRASSGPPRSSSGLYRADSNILLYLFNWDYIAMYYLTKLWIGTVGIVLDSISHVLWHPAVFLRPISGGFEYLQYLFNWDYIAM